MSVELNKKQCPHCGHSVNEGDAFCEYCGSALGDAGNAPDTAAQPGGIPKTIADLKAWTAARHMPLEKMRFFIGVDYRAPKAFGIWEDAPGHFTVYKNKADGSRAVRYSGPDEAYAVRELYEKILSECHLRGIYPDRAEGNAAGSQPAVRSGAGEERNLYDKWQERSRSAKSSQGGLKTLLVIAAFVLILAFTFTSSCSHGKDGYYRRSNGSVYYRYGDSYYTESGRNHWVSTVISDAVSDYFLGSGYSSSYGVSDFRMSDEWEDLHERDDDDDWDWDWDDTDWDSDW